MASAAAKPGKVRNEASARIGAPNGSDPDTKLSMMEIIAQKPGMSGPVLRRFRDPMRLRYANLHPLRSKTLQRDASTTGQGLRSGPAPAIRSASSDTPRA